MTCAPVHDAISTLVGDAQRDGFARTVCADVAALDQMLVYNRFGSFNPYGMVYALRRDLTPAEIAPEAIDADACDETTGVEGWRGALAPGKVRLKDCKRPRPLTLRANVGDVLHVRLSNLLRERDPSFSGDYCTAEGSATGGPFGLLYHKLRQWVSQGESHQLDHREVACAKDRSADRRRPEDDLNWPRSRGANLAIQGLTAIDFARNADGTPRLDAAERPMRTQPHDACTGLGVIAPGETVDCFFLIEREGPFFMASTGAPSGGQGDGGSLTHGLFGAVNVQKTDARWYRSQITRSAFETVWNSDAAGVRHAVEAAHIADETRYELTLDDPVSGRRGVPVLNMLRAADDAEGAFEIVHSDLNAVIWRDAFDEQPALSFREFSVFFHDELKTFYPRSFEELGDFGGGQLAGVRDGFGINYGAGGMGGMVLANRKGIGPAANCLECLYEEFFLTSWANGDPALLEQFSDDPSNVHHSYLNDAVVFRNYHAGPKETHVFHLHAHQWFTGNDKGRGAYLDSQTVAPQQGFSYDIYDGGMELYRRGARPGETGWFDTLGSGNRNRTVGDSIFHCHLYPHFAQGMWELWRVHDTLEDGTRKLPDGQWEPTLSLAEMHPDIRAMKRPGSVDQATGRWIAPGQNAMTGDRLTPRAIGTPIPAVTPLRGQPWPVLPTYAEGKAALSVAEDAEGATIAVVDTEPAPEETEIAAFPGYPFYVAGRPGHRPPQAPMDIARKLSGNLVTGEYLDGGLPRHVVTDNAKRDLPFTAPPDVAERLAKPSQARSLADALADPDLAKREALQSQVIAAALALGDMSMKFKAAEIDLLAYDGEPLERAAMAFHHDGTVLGGGAPLDLRAPDGSSTGFVAELGGYKTLGGSGLFTVNAAPAKPGAPFADPCGAPTEMGRRELAGLTLETDPFVAGLPDPTFAPDPAVIGYRRYEASAVQVDLITNRAGWHDPQARINVLTANSDDYKDGKGRISPTVTASEEPFFFRALSGECIEFRHTNELPKELELDDFQVKTPTDTIGQHIHLVKFDVTSSDGSGNGFNYEDGTFAPDEIAVRICAAKNTASASDVTPNRAPGALAMREFEGLCDFDEDTGLWKVSSTFDKKIWRMKRGAQPDLFQTTTQRWFADPILSDIRAPDDGTGAQAGKADRTLRTVFSHDHFGPSSIQQHGFYTALLIEPATAQICDDTPLSCTAPRADRSMIVGDEADIGARKVIVNLTPEPGDLEEYREYALSIADFALLYDPRDTMSAEEIATLSETAPGADPEAQAARERRMKGMVTLFCEARYGIAGSAPRMEAFCDSALDQDPDGFWFAAEGDTPPAWLAAGRPGDRSDHQADLAANLLADLRVTRKGASLAADDYLLDHLTEYRAAAAGYAADDPRARLASPVAPPQRPESISVDHHDPYLVNYRGEPLPLRIGIDSSASPDCDLKASPEDWVAPLLSGVTERCSISRQRPGDEGDFANVMLSKLHGDPATPIIEAFDGDHLQFRLIQGAQEVQHTFTLEGYSWPRNVDQAFPAARARPWQDDTPVTTLARRCELEGGPLSGVRMASAGRPDQYRAWQRHGWQGFSDPADRAFWRDMEAQIALCFNTDGRIAAQEIGISEHFEFESAFLYDTNFEAVAKELAARAEARRGETVSAATLLEDVRALQRLTRLRLGTLDTPYHFGSQDALWNGAWGLLRVGAKTRRFELFRALDRDLSQRVIDLEALTRDGADVTVPDDLRRQLDPLLADPLGQTLQRRPELGEGAALLTAPRALRAAPLAAPTQEPREAGTDEEEALVQPLTRFRGEAIDAIEAVPPDRLAPLVERLERAGRLDIEDLTAQRLQELFGRLRTPPDPETAIPDYRQVAECDPGAPRVYTAIVAIEAETVFRGATPSGQPGTPYSEELLDGNGLFFALLDPRALIAPESPDKVTDLQIEDRANWAAIPLPRIVDRIRATYHRPEPLVINVNAGDCVHMTVLNALRSREGASPGLSDIAGDAEMPPIVSLDVARAWTEEERPDGTIFATAGTDRRRDAVPSARLALSFPLPVFTRQTAYARPYGGNPVWALAGVDGRAAETGAAVLSIEDRPDLLEKPGPRLAQIEQLEFYAGLVYAPAGIGTTAPLRVSDAVSILLPDLALARLDAGGGPALPDGVAQLPARPELGSVDGRTLGDQIGALQGERAVVTERLARALDGALPGSVDAPSLERILRNPELRARMTARRAGPTPSDALADRGADRDMNMALSIGPRPDNRLVLPMPDAIAELRDAGVIDAETQRRLDGVGDRLLSDYVGRVQALNRSIFEPGTLTKLDANHLPYAFGALPLKSFGDVIGHPAHGLIGAVTVAPRGARATGLRAPRTAFGCDDKLIGPRDVQPALRLSDIRREIAAEWLRAPGLETRCDTFVIAPQPMRGAARASRPMWTARLDVTDPKGGDHAIRQFTLFWQDGLNLRDPGSDDAHVIAGLDIDLLTDCAVCDDSYDLGDKAASYRSEPFHVRLRDTHPFPLESHSDLNRAEFGDRFFRLKPDEISTWDEAPVPVLRAAAGEEVVVHVVHPGGRARQRAFATIGQDYNDLFPGFGFPRAALLAPGKAITASLTKPAEPGCYLWFDGPLHLRAGGVWGLLDVVKDVDDPEATSCAGRPTR